MGLTREQRAAYLAANLWDDERNRDADGRLICSACGRAVPRLASPAYLDSLGAAANGDVAGALQSALPAIDELTRDLELNYKLKLE